MLANGTLPCVHADPSYPELRPGASAEATGVLIFTEEPLEKVMGELRDKFKPEFLNRVDDIVVFKPLSRASLRNIVDIQLKRLERMLEERHIALQVDEPARTWLANAGYDPVYGARPLKRVIQRNLQNPLATLLLEGKIADGDSVPVTVRNGELSINGVQIKAEAA